MKTNDVPQIVSAEWLSEQHPSVRIVDARWYLQHKSGREEYAKGHIPGAVFVALEDISGHGGPGRHPIPTAEKFMEAMRAAGISRTTHVVAYDDAGGSIAARLVWLLHRFGHRQASVLDGGLQAWRGQLETAVPSYPRGDFEAHLDASVVAVDKVHVNEVRGRDGVLVLDARAGERYRGESEPVDARPGHVPGAKSAPWSENLEGGRFKSPEALRAHYEGLGARQKSEIIVYCGSGVTACHDWLALQRAGFSGVKLYEGSWSDWAADASLPAAKGAEP